MGLYGFGDLRRGFRQLRHILWHACFHGNVKKKTSRLIFRFCFFVLKAQCFVFRGVFGIFNLHWPTKKGPVFTFFILPWRPTMSIFVPKLWDTMVQKPFSWKGNLPPKVPMFLDIFCYTVVLREAFLNTAFQARRNQICDMDVFLMLMWSCEDVQCLTTRRVDRNMAWIYTYTIGFTTGK